MLYKVFDFAGKEAHGGDGAAARGGRDLGRHAARGGAGRRARLAVHPLSGLPRVARRDRRCPARARPDLRAERPRDRRGGDRGAAAPGVRRAGDEGPRCAARRVPAREAAPGGRRRRVRGDAGHRHARRPARGDRRRDRGRVRPARRVGRADRRQHDPRSTAPSRSTTSTSSSGRPRAGGLPHARGLRLRPARTAAVPWGRGAADGMLLPRPGDGGLADPAARGRRSSSPRSRRATRPRPRSLPASVGRLRRGRSRPRSGVCASAIRASGLPTAHSS